RAARDRRKDVWNGDGRYDGINWLNRSFIEQKRLSGQAHLRVKEVRIPTEKIRFYAFSAAMPAFATCASSKDLTPETPTAPTHCPSTSTGPPPSSMPCNTGADRKDTRPPLIISS